MSLDPPPGPEGRLDRLSAWMRVSQWRQWLVLYPLVMLITVVLQILWIAVAFALHSTDRDAGAVALNYVLVGVIVTAGLLVIHPSMYRWQWHIERKRRAGELPPDGATPAYGSEIAAPAPRIDWPWPYRLRHGLARLLTVAALLFFFMPYRNQTAIARFLSTHSAGRASAGSLAGLIFFYLPFCVMAVLIGALTWRQAKRRDAGLLSERESLLLEAETTWLFSFGAAVIIVIFLCHFAGGMITAFMV